MDDSQMTSRLAAVDRTGAVLVSEDQGSTWAAIHHCPAPPLSLVENEESLQRCTPDGLPAAAAWAKGTLYIACAGDSLMRWQPGMPSARPAGIAMVNELLTLGQGRGRLLMVDSETKIWSYEGRAHAVYVADCPEPAMAIAELEDAIVVAGPTGVWQLDNSGRTWVLLAGVSACALVVGPSSLAASHGESLWIAGPDGLFEWRTWSLSTRMIVPVTGIAADGNVLWVANGATLVEWSASLEASLGASPVDRLGLPPHDHGQTRMATLAGTQRQDWRELARRARWARWLPALGAGVSYHRTGQTHRDLEVWLWLTWVPDKEVFP